ncbi:flagellar hook-associated protein FlgK [Pelagibius litoralis]|uniref:Flagellar hook-associated protein 1 n=1 Tax=Pelagibius litoralis TaxID=374515 RepID=A0A967EXX7_9PROT|nr:flagellar hook-associated protein FlgK [Pelagibius litoralis]NIA69461.1 flagellar hook-associated protein FlgK [Pelagibius litoralis]
MSLSIALSNALSGLQVNQTALQVTSSNVANVNTPNYARKIHDQQARILSGQGVGVDTAQIIRRIDQFLRRDLMTETTVLGSATVTSDYYNRMQSMFGSLGNNNALGNSITDLSVAIENVANSPEVAAHRFDAVNEAVEMAQYFNNMGTDVQKLRAQADAEISAAVDIINRELEVISDLNAQIANNGVKGLPVGDLQDRRDVAVKTISEYMELQEFTDSFGQIRLFTASGRSLVSGTSYGTLSYTTTPFMTANEDYPTTISGIFLNGGAAPPPSADMTTEIRGGKLEALIQMRDQTLPAMTNQIDQLAAQMRNEVNRVHNRGANTPFGLGTGAGDPAALYGTRVITTPGDALTLGSDVNFAILDANGDSVIPPLTIPAGATTPDAILAAINGHLTTAPGYGTAVWNNDRMEIKLEPGHRLAILDNGPAADMGDATIQFDADGDAAQEDYLGFSNFFGLNDMFVTPNLVTGTPALANQGSQVGISSTIAVRQSIVDDPSYLSRGSLRGTPPAMTLGVGDNEIAQQLAGAFGENFSYASIADGPSATSTTFSGYAGVILSFNASATASADDALNFQTFFFEDLQAKFLSEAGVNMDEELANMTIFQNAYNASARVVQAVDEMFETLLNL